jgi:hypothetical protein
VSNYDYRSRLIERRRRIAEALRQSGAEPLPAALPGRVYAPVSGWEHANKLVQQLLGGYQTGRADRDEAALEQQRAQEQEQWIAGLEGLDKPDRPSPFGNQPLSAEVTNPATGAKESASIPAVSRLQQQRAHALKGLGLGGAPAALGMNLLQQSFAKPETEWKDVGDSYIAIVNGRPTGARIPKGMSPDSVAAREAAASERATTREFTADQNRLQREATATNAQLTREAAAQQRALDREARNSKPLTAKDRAGIQGKLTSLDVAQRQLDVLKEKAKAAKGFSTGGLGGVGKYLPTESGKQFDAAVDQMRQSITGLTRVPGIGAMSDFETRLNQAQLPNRGDYESVVAQKIEGLQNLLDQLRTGYIGALDQDLPTGDEWSVVR